MSTPNASIDMQPTTITQTIQVIQASSNDISTNVFMAEYSFFYKAYNDYQIYHITCKEVSFETASLLSSNHEYYSTQSNNLHVFYYQQPYDKKIYQVICEILSYTFIVCLLNKINYGIELNLYDRENLYFSKERKENLEFHLKQDLINYLAPIQMNHNFNNYSIKSFEVNISQQYKTDNNIFNQFTSSQDNNNQFI